MIKRRIIGLLPAGGQAKRISPLPVSKELYPVGFHSFGDKSDLRPKVVCHYLLEKMQLAGIEQAYFILRPGKWDIPSYFGDGTMLSMSLGYLIMGLPYGVPFTLDQAYPFVQDAVVAFGFPDILFQPDDAFVKLLERQQKSNADVVLGLFPTEQPHKAGMVDFDASGKVHLVIEKPNQSDLRYMWAIAVWTPAFTQFLHDYISSLKASKNLSKLPEIPIGNIIQAGIDQGFHVEAEAFPNGSYLDIGTPNDLAKALRKFTTLVDEEKL
ncbi:sugar phosphate nucleotidyltransferase [Aetokthonos hydrillicola Thurmond2011]|jgi:glucose-1-phosphate thymidylyltransferase|uniref:Glucose-1-phosphate thymidylyltransferase n=1 Tax=Aetokthonos hydrillicola Thurmond2011 TaxID=2712845 RepID=A0AAP5I7Z6_9CYAN|nr:sugar phosphate nucleotidyltransferase [Aetokthonos hydrillicola]MBO3458868.1 dTDP-glucose pyrophosphorylase [Aetokthonos hydrillicola CCALA 1050]MBW4587284.1 dTDP-glucose pyrophosphorylase [Aetokthonos hydrillicola CCALA 1050]MDR9896693.1 sugar phosphate nucleotidyltransferase [Aetokthonos hydrillicola Thurmond2011]